MHGLATRGQQSSLLREKLGGLGLKASEEGILTIATNGDQPAEINQQILSPMPGSAYEKEYFKSQFNSLLYDFGSIMSYLIINFFNHKLGQGYLLP